jgi:hypothetical protein
MELIGDDVGSGKSAITASASMALDSTKSGEDGGGIRG